MGYSPRYGLKDTAGNEFHVEGKESVVAIWEGSELRHILRLSYAEARKLAEDLDIVCRMKENSLDHPPR